MKSDIRLPATFQEYSSEPIIAGEDNLVVPEFAAAIKGNPYFSHYHEWCFDAIIWWDAKFSSWCGEVWLGDEYIATHVAKDLKELAEEMLHQHDEVEMIVSPSLVRKF